jgi:hypothetical protein
MAKVWDDFLPLAKPHIPGCPDITVKTYLAIVAADFFTQTHLWRDDIDPIFTAPGVVEYDLSADVLVEDVVSVVVDETEIMHTDVRLIPNNRRYETGRPTHYWIHSDNSIRLFPIPDERIRLRLTGVLKPSRTATGVEDWIYETWADALVSGTIARLAMIPGKEWTDPGLAEVNNRQYQKAITHARIRDARGVGHNVTMRPAA